jgi:hypothetical protein
MVSSLRAGVATAVTMLATEPRGVWHSGCGIGVHLTPAPSTGCTGGDRHARTITAKAGSPAVDDLGSMPT